MNLRRICSGNFIDKNACGICSICQSILIEFAKKIKEHLPALPMTIFIDLSKNISREADRRGLQ